MYKKIVIPLVIIVIMLTGCTKIDNNVDNIVNAIMTEEINEVNTVSTGYELYIPIGVRQVVDNEYNQKLKVKDTNIYLYVDTVSYYYKNSLNYKKSNNYNYYYRDINLNNKLGYIGISKLEDGSFFVEIVYNYSKIEFYTNEENMPVIISNCLIIINSIKYNDVLIELELDGLVNSGMEIKYELDKPKDSISTFDQYLQEYIDDTEEEIVLPDVD